METPKQHTVHRRRGQAATDWVAAIANAVVAVIVIADYVREVIGM